MSASDKTSETLRLHFAGTIDVTGFRERTPILADLKTGRPQKWHEDQVNLYRHLFERQVTDTTDGFGETIDLPALEMWVYYITKDGVEKKRVPRVPVEEILKRVPEDQETALDPKRKPEDYELVYYDEDHRYCLELKGQKFRIPSVNELLVLAKKKKPYPELPGGNPWAEFGTKLHRWIEAEHNGVDIEKALEEAEPDAAKVLRTYMGQWRDFTRKEKVVVYRHETRVWGWR